MVFSNNLFFLIKNWIIFNLYNETDGYDRKRLHLHWEKGTNISNFQTLMGPEITNAMITMTFESYSLGKDIHYSIIEGEGISIYFSFH